MESLSPVTLPVDISPAERLRRSEEAGRALVSGWESSGMTMRAYAKQQGILPQRLSYWRLRLGHRARPETGPHPDFVEIVHPPRVQDGVVVELPRGIRVRVDRGFDADVLRSVVAALICDGAVRC